MFADGAVSVLEPYETGRGFVDGEKDCAVDVWGGFVLEVLERFAEMFVHGPITPTTFYRAIARVVAAGAENARVVAHVAEIRTWVC